MTEFAHRCRGLGVAVLLRQVDEQATVRYSPVLSDDAEMAALAADNTLTARLEQEAGLVNADSPGRVVRLSCGHWCLDFGPLSSRDHRRSLIGITSTDSREDQAALEELARLAMIWKNDLLALDIVNEEVQGLGERLCACYEELSLLYRLGTNMNVAKRPETLLKSICDELYQVLAFRWIAFRWLGSRDSSWDLDPPFVFAGTLPDNEHRTSERLHRRLAALRPMKPMILNDAAETAAAGMEGFGDNLLIHPIVNHNEVLGAVVAAGKHGDDPLINNLDITLISATVSHLQIYLDNLSLYDQTQQTFLGSLEALTAAIDAKDPYTCGHSQRVAMLASRLAAAAGLDDATARRVFICGLVHDIGKIGVPEAVLGKAGKLSDEEFEAIKKHPEIGARILRDIPNMDDIIPGVLYHHERYDGRGYPAGLAGEDIPLFGRVLAIADSFDAMSSSRTYRRALPRLEVLEEIRRCKGTQFDPALADAFLTLSFVEYDEMMEQQRLPVSARIRGEAA